MSESKIINAADEYSRRIKDEKKTELLDGDYKEQIGNKNLEKDLNKTRSIFVDHPDNKTEPQYKRINAAEIYSRRISKEENESIFEESYREGIGN